jgi:hypothetical protein
MAFPSLQVLHAAALRAAGRFPAVLVAAAVAAVAGMIAVGHEDEDVWLRLMGTAALAIPLLLAIDIVGQRHRWSLAVRAPLWIAGSGLLAWFMTAWSVWSEPVAAGRYLQLSAAFHLLVAVGPYLRVREDNGFWHYNRTLLFRGIAAVVFAGVLFAGLAVAVLALDKLFGLNVEPETYPRLWLLIAFVFATWFFLAGVPDDFAALQRDETYDRSIKVFAQYVLVPLVGIYLVILTLYLVKVLVTQQWPSGWIGWLVSSVAAAGIFSLLMIYPVARRDENRWMRTYARAFYVAILPSIVMLWLAIGQRIGQYGITEKRYFLTLLSVWLAGVAIYYAITRSRDMRIIPATLCLGALLAFAGPWGPYHMSARSQLGRLQTLLEGNAMLVDGSAQPAPRDVPHDDRREISAVLRYLINTHGTDALVPWFGDRLTAVETTEDGTGPSSMRRVEDRARAIVALLGIDYVGPWAPGESSRFSYYMVWDRTPIEITGYDVWLQVENLTGDSAIIDGRVVLRYDSTAAAIAIDPVDAAPTALPLDHAIERIEAAQRTSGQRGLDPESMRLEWESDTERLLIFIARVSGERVEETLQVSDLDLRVFYARSP